MADPRYARCALAALLALASVGCREPRQVCPELPAPTSRVGEIPLDLPKASEIAAPGPMPAPGAPPQMKGAPDAEITPLFVVTLGRIGEVSADGTKIADVAELGPRARAVKAADARVRAVIHADRNASWAMVVQVIDQLKQAGVDKIAFAVDVAQPPAPSRP